MDGIEGSVDLNICFWSPGGAVQPDPEEPPWWVHPRPYQGHPRPLEGDVDPGQPAPPADHPPNQAGEVGVGPGPGRGRRVLPGLDRGRCGFGLSGGGWTYSGPPELEGAIMGELGVPARAATPPIFCCV